MMLYTAGITVLSLLTAAAAQMTVQVGFEASDPGGIFQFSPNNFNATNGTVITFQFKGAPGNHSVTQSLFASPCTPATGGFDSGWVFIPSPVSQVPEWNLTITNDQKPIWFFCKQLSPSPHCAAGMVGAINAPTTGNTFAAFQATAMKQTTSGQQQGALVGLGASASAGVGPIPSGVTAYTGVIAAATGTGASNASGSATSPASTASPTKSSGSKVVVSSLFGLSAAVLGLVLV